MNFAGKHMNQRHTFILYINSIIIKVEVYSQIEKPPVEPNLPGANSYQLWYEQNLT